ncbi:ATP-binding protein [Streptomyces sp. NBC_01408]|uniref:ATP-binding protein n=1 Tax=Streptomyces sp. NBC_01408 TaxID=2903855 RepID=UPI002250E85F|nr:ATP-binding protein [Streptomyces sp. NBC_01408]MCX4693665.1 ATP-binding protein [Streptomyces sp. NBC_01408]
MLFLSGAHREPGDLAQEIFEACYEAARYVPSGPELRRLMTGIRVTVYMDNAELTADQIRELMDAAPDACFVFAGRERSLLGEGTALELTGLDRGAGLELLTREVGNPTPEGERAAVELWQAAAGRPLFLLRAAALARRDAAGVVVLPLPGALAEVLPLLLDQLDPEAMRGLHLLATLADAELDPVHVGALAGATNPAALCGRLVDLGLAEATERGFRCATDTVQALRGRNLDPFPVARLCEYFAWWVTRRSTSPGQIADHARALEIAAELAERAGRPDLAVSVARAASPALARSLRFGQWGRVLGRGRIAAQHAGDQRALAYFTHEEGIRSLLTGRRVVSGILLAEAAILWRQLGDTAGANAAAGAQQYAPSQLPLDPSLPDPSLPDPSLPDPSLSGSSSPDTLPSGQSQPVPVDGGSSSVVPGDPSVAGQSVMPADPVSVPAEAVSGSGSTAGPGGSGADPGLTDHAAAHTGDLVVTPMPAGPGPAAPMPPGAEQVGSVVGNAAGGVSTGAAATAGGAGAAGASALTVVLTVIAISAALVIAAVAIGQQQTTDDPPSVAASTARPTPTRVPVIPVPTGLPAEPRPTPTPTPTPTGLAGVWRDDQGAVHKIEEERPGVYALRFTPICGGEITMKLTGAGGIYRSTDEPLYEEGSCALIGYFKSEITVAADGRTALWSGEPPAGAADLTCLNCEPIALTRVE